MYDQYFRGLSVLIAAAIVAIIILSCGPSVRNSDIYNAEIDFMEAAATEQVQRGVALIDASCKCEEMMGVRGFTTTECQDLAETILVVKYRMKYHTSFMRYLGGISERRPPEIPPEVPDANALCPDAPMPIPDELVYVDAGVDAGD